MFNSTRTILLHIALSTNRPLFFVQAKVAQTVRQFRWKSFEVFQNCFRLTCPSIFTHRRLIKPARRFINQLRAAFPMIEIIVPFLVLAVDFHKITNFTQIMRLRTIHTIFTTDPRFLIGFTYFGFIQKRMIYHFQLSMCHGTSVPQNTFFMFFPLRTRFWNVVEKALTPLHRNSPPH